MNDIMRTEFEAWALSNGYSLSGLDGDARYHYMPTEHAWQGWQAATALAKHEGTQAEPVAWQMRMKPDGGWFDCPVTDYLQHLIDPLIDPAWEVRALYTAAPDTRDAAEATQYVREIMASIDGRLAISVARLDAMRAFLAKEPAIDAARSTTNG